jgi:hypothetical protein
VCVVRLAKADVSCVTEAVVVNSSGRIYALGRIVIAIHKHHAVSSIGRLTQRDAWGLNLAMLQQPRCILQIQRCKACRLQGYFECDRPGYEHLGIFGRRRVRHGRTLHFTHVSNALVSQAGP